MKSPFSKVVQGRSWVQWQLRLNHFSIFLESVNRSRLTMGLNGLIRLPVESLIHRFLQFFLAALIKRYGSERFDDFRLLK